MHLWATVKREKIRIQISTFVICIITAKCNWQMSGNDSFLSTRTYTLLTGATNIAKSMVNTINPIFEKTAWQNFTADFSRSINLSPKFSYWEKRIQKKETTCTKFKWKMLYRKTIYFFFMIRKTVSQHEWEILTVWFRKGEESTSFFACPISRFVRYFFFIWQKRNYSNYIILLIKGHKYMVCFEMHVLSCIYTRKENVTEG